MTTSNGKIFYLDGIRGTAALLVFFHHFLLAFYSAYFSFDPTATNLNGLDIRYGQSVFSVLSNGRFCVYIFFVLSGFVLSRKYYQTSRLELVISGAQRRFLRLYIPVAATMIIAFILMQAGMYYNVPVGEMTHSKWWLGSLWHFSEPFKKLWYCLKVGTMFNGDAAFDTSLWTMSVEFMGSLFVFAFLAFTHHTKNRFACLVMVFLYCKFTDQQMLMDFVFGISLNYVEQFGDRVSRLLKRIAIPLLLAAAMVLGSFPSNHEMKNTVFEHLPPFVLSYYEWFHVVGAYFLVLAFVLSPTLQKVFSTRPFRFLGHISFSFYMLHPLVIGSFSCYLFLKLHDHFGYHQSVALIFVATITMSILVSWLMTKYIDDPGIRFSKYVYDRWIKPKQVQQTASTGGDV